MTGHVLQTHYDFIPKQQHTARICAVLSNTHQLAFTELHLGQTSNRLIISTHDKRHMILRLTAEGGKFKKTMGRPATPSINQSVWSLFSDWRFGTTSVHVQQLSTVTCKSEKNVWLLCVFYTSSQKFGLIWCLLLFSWLLTLQFPTQAIKTTYEHTKKNNKSRFRVVHYVLLYNYIHPAHIFQVFSIYKESHCIH